MKIDEFAQILHERQTTYKTDYRLIIFKHVRCPTKYYSRLKLNRNMSVDNIIGSSEVRRR